MEQWITFLQDRWLVVLLVIAAVFIIVKVVKTVVKWLLVLIILAGLFYYGSTYSEEIKDIGESVMSQAKEAAEDLKEKVIQGLAGKHATYTDNKDGTYTVSSGNIRLDGKNGDNKVKLTVAGLSAEVTLDDLLKKVIAEAKNNK